MGFVLETFASTSTPLIQVSKEVQSLTPREREVARLVSDGLSNSVVAQRLGLSIHTVKNYLFTVFDRIGISNRSELILCLLASTTPPKKPVTNTTAGTRESRATLASRGVSLVGKRPYYILGSNRIERSGFDFGCCAHLTISIASMFPPLTRRIKGSKNI